MSNEKSDRVGYFRAGSGQVEEAEAEIAQLQEAPRGLLRINAHSSFGALHLVPTIAAFMTRYPDVQVQLTLTNVVRVVLQCLAARCATVYLQAGIWYVTFRELWGGNP